MTPFDERDDDLSLEELEAQNRALTHTLSRAYQRSTRLSTTEQGESVARVRERLMLAVKVTLTNNSQKNAYPGLPFSGGSCGYYPGVEIPYTGSPQFNIPIAFDHRCPYTPVRPATLKPGQTMSLLRYIPLQQSGQLTLLSPAKFYTGPASQQIFSEPTTLPDLFGSSGLVTRIHVSPTIPANRRIPFKVQRYNVIVEAPSSARGPLLYAYSIVCDNGGGSMGSGNYSAERQIWLFILLTRS